MHYLFSGTHATENTGTDRPKYATLHKIEEGHYIAFDQHGLMYSFISKGQLLLIAKGDSVIMYNLSFLSSNKMDTYMINLFNNKK